MPTIIIFSTETKAERHRVAVDEDAATVAHALQGGGLAKLTSRGEDIWINAAHVRALRERTAGSSDEASAMDESPSVEG